MVSISNRMAVRSKYSAGGLGLWRQHELGRRRNNSWPKDDACSQNLEVCTLDAGRGFATTTGMPHEIPTIPVSGHYGLGGLEMPANPGGPTAELPRVAWWIALLLLPGCGMNTAIPIFGPYGCIPTEQ